MGFPFKRLRADDPYGRAGFGKELFLSISAPVEGAYGISQASDRIMDRRLLLVVGADRVSVRRVEGVDTAAVITWRAYCSCGMGLQK
jgi:hypothetical protein